MIAESATGTGLTCPACTAPMAALGLDGHYGTTVELDLCETCHGIWFDCQENLRLTPGATLALFERIHDGAKHRRPLAGRLSCPRCRMRLRETSDRQRNTPFRYWRCGQGHGRFITFFDFLREKEFIRPLDAAQLAELRQQVRSVNCSNCGAPIDLQRASACGYCRAPLSMLDIAQVRRMLDQLGRAEQARVAGAQGGATRPGGIDPAVVLSMLRERRKAESFFNQLDRRPDWSALTSYGGLVEVGVGAVVGLLRRLR